MRNEERLGSGEETSELEQKCKGTCISDRDSAGVEEDRPDLMSPAAVPSYGDRGDKHTPLWALGNRWCPEPSSWNARIDCTYCPLNTEEKYSEVQSRVGKKMYLNEWKAEWKTVPWIKSLFPNKGCILLQNGVWCSCGLLLPSSSEFTVLALKSKWVHVWFLRIVTLSLEKLKQ